MYPCFPHKQILKMSYKVQDIFLAMLLGSQHRQFSFSESVLFENPNTNKTVFVKKDLTEYWRYQMVVQQWVTCSGYLHLYRAIIFLRLPTPYLTNHVCAVTSHCYTATTINILLRLFFYVIVFRILILLSFIRTTNNLTTNLFWVLICNSIVSCTSYIILHLFAFSQRLVAHSWNNTTTILSYYLFVRI